MKCIAALVIVSGALAGIAQADVIVYDISGTIGLLSGGDAGGLDGASFSMTANFDDSGTYIERFGFASVDGGLASFAIAGAGNGANNTTTNSNENSGFYPIFAGIFTAPDGGQITFNTGDGELFQFHGNTIRTPGSANAVIGGAIELDDFAPGGTYNGADGGGALSNLINGDTFTLNNVTISAHFVPAPGALALLGFAGLAANRRRR